ASVVRPATESSVSDAASSTDTEPVTPGGRIQTITFKKDMRIQDALQFLQERYQKNIVPSAKVDGTINVISLHDVTFEQALDAILGRDFAIETEGNIIKVYTAAEYNAIKEDPERMTHEIFTLYYITAADAKKLVIPVLSSSASMKVETTTAAETTFPTGESISSVTGGGDAAAMNDAIIIYDFPENVEEAGKVLKKFDVRPRQVLIEATIMSVALTEGMQFGIDWQTLKGTAVSALTDISPGAEDYLKSAGTGARVGSSSLTGGLTVGFALGDVGSFIRAVEEISDVTLLANPKILAVNKQLGQVYIGKKIAYQTQTTVSEGGTATEQVGFLDTGTKLAFRPYIGNDGYIRMDIHPKDSSGEVRTVGSASLPDETSAELVTNIMVKDGETIVIGGLFRDKISTVRTQVPVLGDIPLIGLLFRGKADEMRREEVVVLLTPHIIDEPSQTDGDGRSDDVRRKREGALDELQPIGSGKIAEEYYVDAVRCYTQKDMSGAMENVRLALRVRPAYLEAIRLKERILRETSPEEAAKLDRIILEDADKREAPKWLRR
ncbi:MAG: hypothetical protein JXN61_04945, partial [Sedimentisphaerales bacterium]|nr:hypothetical protein [Sedimentisphaerales bacterium]